EILLLLKRKDLTKPQQHDNIQVEVVMHFKDDIEKYQQIDQQMFILKIITTSGFICRIYKDGVDILKNKYIGAGYIIELYGKS
ncbi:Proteasome component domain protein, partial [Perilla frutescens var. frutescens]